MSRTDYFKDVEEAPDGGLFISERWYGLDGHVSSKATYIPPDYGIDTSFNGMVGSDLEAENSPSNSPITET